MTAHLIANPGAAGVDGERLEAIRRNLAIAFPDLHVYRTSAPGDATAATRRFLEAGTDCVLAAGGDGTLNEVVNGFFTDEGEAVGKAKLGLVPLGSGSDFCKSIGLSRDPLRAAAQLAGAMVQALDVGEVVFGDGRRRFFLNVADCGVGGEVVRTVNSNPYKGRGIRGSAAFFGASMLEVLRYERRPVEIICDGDASQALVQSVVFANGQYFGGGMRIAPDASLTDGLLDVLVLEVNRPRAIWSFPKLYRGRHLGTAGVQLLRCREAEVRPQGPQPLRFDIDGEPFGEAPARIRCRAAAVEFLVPGKLPATQG